jgi:hypothetical protein
MQNDYQAVYKNTGLLPRTLDEAERNATYASPIMKFESDNAKAMDIMGWYLVIGVLMLIIGLAVYNLWLH